MSTTKVTQTSPAHVLVLSPGRDYRTSVIDHLVSKGHTATGAFDEEVALQIIREEKLRSAPISLILIEAPNAHEVGEVLYAKLTKFKLDKMPTIVILDQRSYRIQRGSINNIASVDLKALVNTVK